MADKSIRPEGASSAAAILPPSRSSPLIGRRRELSVVMNRYEVAIAVSSNGPKEASKTNQPLARLSIHGKAKKVNWISTKQGCAQVVLLAGEPGIGKTRLLDEIATFTETSASGSHAVSTAVEERGVPYLGQGVGFPLA